ncbi:MAG TPA: porin, partial [bacterium]|nr:porin [bacterium]
APGIHGGESRQLMLGINYYPNPAIKLQFNYSRVNLDQYATRNGNMFGNDDHSFIQGRIQASL